MLTAAPPVLAPAEPLPVEDAGTVAPVVHGAQPDWAVPVEVPVEVPAAPNEGAPQAEAFALAAGTPADDPWATPAAAAEPVSDWQPDAPSAEFETPKSATPAETPPAAEADWSSLRSGPDWSAPQVPANTDVETWAVPAAAAEPAEWTPAAPAAAPMEWSPAASAPALAQEWAPPAPEPARSAPAPAWNAPAVGASALEQLESETPEPEPGAAQELFGSVPAGGSLSGPEDDEYAPSGDLGPPVELASPEEVLRPLDDIDHDDPDLPAAVEQPAAPRPQPLAAWRPAASTALEVRGEHRVAVHTRGGRTLRGTLRDVDLGKSQFPLLPQGAGAPEAIYHSDVKAIFFMLAPGEKPAPGDGRKVRVTFADGRVIEGTREGADAKHGFFLVPADAARTNTRRIYVAREATAEIQDR